MMARAKQEVPMIVKTQCLNCGGQPKNHSILKNYAYHWDSVDDRGGGNYQICQCNGCEAIRFRYTYWNEAEDYRPESGEIEEHEVLYPEAPKAERKPILMDLFPDSVQRIYEETIKAFNAGALILAGAGLRAIVEAICLERNLKGNLEDKIDALVSGGLLARTQADLLHEERYIGNAAIHEIKTPAKRDIIDGLGIIEGLLNTIYVLPEHAKRLKAKRESKKA
jgi:hypothetical protein